MPSLINEFIDLLLTEASDPKDPATIARRQGTRGLLKSLYMLALIDAGRAVPGATRESLVASIPRVNLATYERARASRGNGVCVVDAVDTEQACSACRMQIRPQRSVQLRSFDSVLGCEKCGCIFVTKDIAIETAREIAAVEKASAPKKPPPRL